MAGAAGSPAPPRGDDVERLASVLAHRLGQTVALIQGYSELLADASESQPQDVPTRREAMEGMGTGVRRLQRFTEDLLDLGWLAAAELRPERLDPAEAAVRAAAALRSEPAARNAEIEVSALPAVRMDPDQCDRLMLHLLRQAAAAGAIARPRARVSGELQGEWVQLDVADEGPLVGAEELEALFAAGSPARGAGPLLGAGVGLWIARRIVERHGGQIWARPARPQGLTVSFTLPAG